MTSKDRLTEDLLARLLAAPNVESYLGEPDSTVNRALPHYLRELLDEKGMKRAEVVRASGLNGTVVYDIFALHASRDATAPAPVWCIGAVAQGASGRHHHLVH